MPLTPEPPRPVVITGGAGFLGQLLVEEILAVDPATSITVVDLVASRDERVTSLVSDLAEAGQRLAPTLAAEPCRIFHLASVVSSAAEQDWAGATQANISGLMGLLGALADSPHIHQLIFASSVAVFGGALAAEEKGPGDSTKQTPTSTYGMTKAVGELLINDATRKGFIDGRVARLPTVIVRPGKPNAAASSFCSGMFREPLAGVECVIPVRPDVQVVVIGAPTAAACLLGLADVDTEAIGSARAVSLPGLSVTVADMVNALRDVGGNEATKLLSYRFDPAIESIVAGWPAAWEDSRGRELGLPTDESLRAIVQNYGLQFDPEQSS